MIGATWDGNRLALQIVKNEEESSGNRSSKVSSKATSPRQESHHFEMVRLELRSTCSNLLDCVKKQIEVFLKDITVSSYSTVSSDQLLLLS